MTDARLAISMPRWAKLLAGAVILLLLCFSAFLVFRWPFSQGRITQSLEETFPAKVTFTKFRSTWFPHPGCVAEGVVFHWLANPKQDPPVATVANLRIEAHYTDLLFRPGYLAHIDLTGFRVNAPKIGTPRQPYDWHETPSSIRVGEILADGSVLTIAREDEDSPLIFKLHKASFTSVSRHKPLSFAVSLHNPLPPGEVVARGQFGPWNSEEPGATAVSGNYAFHQADLGVFHGIAGTLSSNDEFFGSLQHMEAKGDVDVPDFMVTHSRHAVHVRSTFHAFINGLNGDVRLDRVNAGFLGTNVSASGDIKADPALHGKVASIDLFVTEGRIQDVLRLFVREPQPPLNGVTSLRAHVVLPPGDGSFLEKVRLTGDFGIVGGQFTTDSTQGSVAELSERARGGKPDDPPPDADSIVSNLSGHVELRCQVATFTGFSFSVPGADAKMHGAYNIQTRAVDLHGTLKTQAEFSHMTTGFKSVLLKPFNALFRKKHAGAVLPAHLVGTYDDPQPGLDIVSKNSPPPSDGTANRQ